jgi:hypothetical protein
MNDKTWPRRVNRDGARARAKKIEWKVATKARPGHVSGDVTQPPLIIIATPQLPRILSSFDKQQFDLETVSLVSGLTHHHGALRGLYPPVGGQKS